MRIAIISTFDVSGGAAKAAYRLHKGLRSLGHDPTMLVKLKMSCDSSVVEHKSQRKKDAAEEQIINVMQEKWINRNRTPISNTMFSLPYPGNDLSRSEPVMNSDVLNLHWVARYQSVESLAKLLESGKPVLWTFHDQWGFTGGCHYSAGCDKYQSDCRDCPQLQDNRFQIPFFVLKSRLSHLPGKVTIVTPSQWLASSARKSKVFERCRIEVIPNSLETDVFRPEPKEKAKNALGINPDAVTLLFGAWELEEKRKGLDLLLKSVQCCLENPEVKELAKKGRIKVLTFGIPDPEVKALGISLVNLGKIVSDEELSVIYSASDIFILPSREDNLPNTILEAMSCGTPVVSFRVGGIPDLVENGRTGYLAQPGNFKEMGDLIIKLVLDEELRAMMSSQARSLAEREFHITTQASRYLDLFQDVLAERCKEDKTPHVSTAECSADSERAAVMEGGMPSVDSHLSTLYQQCSVELIVQKNEEIDRLVAEVQRRLAEIEGLTEIVRNRDDLVTWLKADIEVRDSHIEAFKQLVQERDGWIEELKAYIENSDRLVRERDGWVTWLKSEIEKRDVKIQKMGEQFDVIVNGYAYKTGKILLSPIAGLLKVLKKPDSP